MSRWVASIDRILTFIVGLCALAGGLWSIGLFFNEPNSQQLADHINNQVWLAAYGQDWFPFAAVAVVVFSLVFAVLIVGANLRRHRINRVVSGASNQQGHIVYNLNQIARAAAHNIDDQIIHVDDVTHAVALDRGRPTMTFTVHAQPNINMKSLIDTLTATEQDIRSALTGQDIDVIFRIHLTRLS